MTLLILKHTEPHVLNELYNVVIPFNILTYELETILRDIGISLSLGTYRRLGYKNIKCLDHYCKLPNNLGLYDLRHTLIQHNILTINNNLPVKYASKKDICLFLSTYKDLKKPFRYLSFNKN